MNEKKPNQKRHQKPAKPSLPLTPEQEAELKAAIAKSEAERKEKEKRQAAFDASVPKMSDNQIRGHLRRHARNYEGSAHTSAESIALLIVLDNTNTPTNKKGKLSSYPR